MEENIQKISFHKKPISIPPEYRILFKIAELCLILKFTCRSNKAKLLKLHLLSWSLKSYKNMDILYETIRKDFREELMVWGIEPTLNRALQFSIADGFCKYENGNYHITEKGLEFAKLIEDQKDLLSEEISFLKTIGKSTVTDNKLKQLTDKWTLLND